MEDTLEMLEEIEDDLMARAFLFDHPVAYRDGVSAALDSLRAMLAKRRTAVA